MKILNKISKGIKKLAMGAVLAGALIFGGNVEAAPKTNISVSDIMSNGSIPTLRLEAYTMGLPGDSDLYNVFEHQDDNDFYLTRAQYFPLSFENFGLGVAAQHVDGTNFDAHDEYGLALRLSGKPTDNSFAKMTAQYFPSRDSIGAYGFVDTKKVFADILASYNTDSKNASFRLGTDFKLPNDLFIGPELKMSGRFGDLKKNYLGLRVRKKF